MHVWYDACLSPSCLSLSLFLPSIHTYTYIHTYKQYTYLHTVQVKKFEELMCMDEHKYTGYIEEEEQFNQDIALQVFSMLMLSKVRKKKKAVEKEKKK